MYITLDSVWKDLDKRRQILLPFVAIVFIGLSYYLDNKSDNNSDQAKKDANIQITQANKSRDSIARINDTLQGKLSAKADTINQNLQSQDLSFLYNFKQQLTRLNNANNDLSILKNTTKILNDTLNNEVLIQKQTNKAATELFFSQKENDSVRTDNYKRRLIKTYKELYHTFDYISFGGANSPIFDSVEKAQFMNQAVTKGLELLNSEFDNPILLTDSLLYKPWQTFQNQLEQYYWDLNGYGYPPLIQTLGSIDISSMYFLQNIGPLLSNNYLWESEENKKKMQPHP